VQPTFLQADIVERLGVKPRSVQFWTANGVLVGQKQRSGSGIHRRYSFEDFEIAAIAGELSRYGLPISTLKAAADWFRSVQRWQNKFGLFGAAGAEIFLRVQYFKRAQAEPEFKSRNKGRSLRDILELYNLEHLQELPKGEPEISEDEHRQIRSWINYDRARNPQFEGGDGITATVGVRDDGAFVGDIGYGDLDGILPSSREAAERLAEFDSIIVLRLSRIFHRAWRGLIDG
jgi:DNA-binding transcriptional MerR regulator